VKATLLRFVAAPKFEIGEQVTIPNKDGEAVIASIEWHDRDEKPFFHVSRDGTLDPKRYWTDDLRSIQRQITCLGGQPGHCPRGQAAGDPSSSSSCLFWSSWRPSA
jgi:hypothetical protein